MDSTSLEASRRASEGRFGPEWIVARAQTAGKGRSGREWISKTGNLYATALIPLVQITDDVPILALTTGLAVRDAIEVMSEARIRPTLKWPNDVRVQGAKISGILLETGQTKGALWLSVGIGINLSHAPEIPNYKTTSLKALTDRIVPVEAAIKTLDEALRKRFAQHLSEGRAGVLSDWLAHTDQLGELCSHTHNGERVEGKCVGLDALGHLQIERANGQMVTITAGDVDLVREK